MATKSQVEEAASEAIDAFYEVLRSKFPQLDDEDPSPELVEAFESAARTLALNWAGD